MFGNDGRIAISGAGHVWATEFGVLASLGKSDISINLTGNITNADTGNEYDGISTSTKGNMSIISAGTIRADGHGIYAATGAASGAIAIAISGDVFGDSFGTGASGDGIRASAYGGNVTVTGTAGADLSGQYGLRATSVSGAVLVNLNGNVTATQQDGILATRGAGPNPVSVTFGGGHIGAADDGIYARVTGTGNVTVSTGAGSSITAGGDGIEAHGAGGAVVITSHSTIDADPGIVGFNTGTGNVTIASYATITADGHGILATAERGVTRISVNQAIDADDNNNASGYGVSATVTTGTIDITSSAAGDILGDAQRGIFALKATGGDGGSDGIDDGHIFIALNGDIGTLANPVDGIGIEALSFSSPSVGNTGNVVISGNGAIFAAATGIYAQKFGTGSISITTGPAGSITSAGGHGIVARTTAGPISVTVGGNVTATSGAGIRALAGTQSTIAVSAGAQVTGKGAGGSWVIETATGSAAGTTTINNAGTIKSTAAGAAAFDDLAITELGPGRIVLNNSGRLEGVVDFSAAASSTIANSSTTSWHVTGTSTLSPGADTLSNSGLLAANSGGVATTFAFGNGSDSFNNSGTLVVGEPLQGAAVLTLTSLEAFNNSGAIYLGAAGAGPLTALPSGTDGFTNDQLVAAGAAFIGSGNSALFLDAFLGASGTADKLVAGALSGATTINVHDTNPGAGAFNQILVVDGTSSTTTAFKLPGTGKINKGLVDYVLQRNGADWYLAGVAAPKITNVTTITTPITNNGWNVSVTLTQKSGKRFAPGAVRDGAFWVAGLASDDGESFADISRFYGLAFGADFGARLADGSDLLFGMFGGYGKPLPMQLDGSAVAQAQNWQAGAYIGHGAAFADVTLKGEAIDGGVRIPDAGYSVLKGNSFAAEANAGLRLAAGNWYFEPVATLTSHSARLDTLHVLGGAVDFGNTPLLDTGLTARFGGAWTAGQTTLRPYAMAGVWHALSGSSGATLISGGTSLRVDDPLAQDWTAFGAGLDLVRANGVSAFLSGTQVTGQGRERSEVRAGLRWTFGG
jgi:outer membrane autotransporter protein